MRVELMDVHALSRIYSRAHDIMRNVDGLQPHEAFDELLKILFVLQKREETSQKSVQHLELILPLGDRTDRLREDFSLFTRRGPIGAWAGEKLSLSQKALATLQPLFADVTLSRLPFDLRSAALREFLGPEVRRGLGIYLTPDPVVRMMVSVVNPSPSDVVYDPACGSGTFLLETLKLWQSKSRRRKGGSLLASDISGRMVHLAELNLGDLKVPRFKGFVQDALNGIGKSKHLPPAGVDVIFTNPPFGVTVEGNAQNADGDVHKLSPSDGRGLPSEILFVKRCLEWLRPGGILGIVLPKSVITNNRLSIAREAFGKLGYVVAAAALPSETFSSGGTQTTTWALFIRKYKARESRETPVRVVFARVENVGYDATGRSKLGNQLEQVALDIAASLRDGQSCGLATPLPPVPRKDSFETLAAATAEVHRQRSSITLGELVTLANTGRTPSRSGYTDSGLFILKVGNLTGRGIYWEARDRNYVPTSLLARTHVQNLLLRPGDIVLTSSAHAPKYIAKKVDVVDEIPEHVGGRAIFVGEIMRLRCEAGVNPLKLAAYLRSAPALRAIHAMIRGQTAHLGGEDLRQLPVPESVLQTDPDLDALASLIREELVLSAKVNDNFFNQTSLLASVFPIESV